MKYASLLFATALLSTACSTFRTVSKQWKSEQTATTWSASFEQFTGTERLRLPSQPEQLVYLSSQVTAKAGQLQLVANDQVLPTPTKVGHHKIPLTQPVRVEIVGKQAVGAFTLRYPVFQQKQITVNANPNIELLGLCYLLTQYDDLAAIPSEQTFLIDGQNIRIKDLYALNLKLAAPFTRFAGSRHMAVIKSYFEKDFYLHYANFLLSLDAFPQAVVPADSRFVRQFASLDDARRFIGACNAFYQEIAFDAFLRQHRPYYAAMLAEVSGNLPPAGFITEMEHLYSKQVSQYRLYPSLLVPFGSGFAVGDEQSVGNIFGSFVKPESIADTAALRLGFADSKALRTVCIHEFGHSFVNPEVDQVSVEALAKTAFLFEPIKGKMSEQGYNQWKICLYEHFNRAGEVLVARLVGDPAKAAELLQDNVKNREFLYLPQIVEKLDYWYHNEYLDKTYQQKVQEIVADLR